MADLALLFIIDVQRGFINSWTEFLPPLVERLQDKFARVIATRFENPEGSPFRALKGLARFAPGSPEAELAFAPRTGARVMVKTGYSAAAPALAAELKAHGIAAAHLCGIATDNCVLKTAVDLFEAGIRPLVIKDACASHAGPEFHRAGLMLLGRFVGEDQIITLAELPG